MIDHQRPRIFSFTQSKFRPSLPKSLFRTFLLLLPFFLHAQPAPVPHNGFLVQTTGKLPFLEYGLGDDRLGGAKMGFLDSNILLTVVDSAGTDYKVQLSKYHSAYIAKENVKPAVPGKISRPFYFTTNLRAYGDTAFDYLTVTLDEKLPYATRQQLDPSRIELDIFGATSNTNWITQLSTASEIKNVWYQQVEDDLFRATIELNHPQHWGYSLHYDTAGNKLILRIRRQPPPDIRNLRIAIDAGHGGDNSGAAGVTTKITEKAYTLLIAKELECVLQEAGVQNIFMTRIKDTSLSMPERIDMLRQYDPQLLISIHLNSSSLDSISGVSTYYRYPGFRPLTMAVLRQMLTLGLKEYGNVGSFNFALSGPTDYPNCLVEVAFLSNPEDEKKIIDPVFRHQAAVKIYQGIMDWLNAPQH